MIKAILFDLDGTLVDTNDLIIKTFQYTFKTVLGLEIKEAEILSFFGEPLATTMERYSKDKKEELINFYKEHNMKTHDDYIKKIDGALDGVKLLKKAGYKLGIVTSKIKTAALKGLEFAEMVHYMDVIVTPEDTELHKPNPEPIYKACEILKIKPEEVIMIGDSSYDILCGKNAGAKTALVSYTALNKEELLKLKPDMYINSIVELYNTIK
ncbi:pyrophosphatase PpaX [Hathewaya histolytica]|uniref:pyrophosphatase PpaX n=1 Tax=Hathewaya histolytica TaxID=1498 RepID=UPI003B67C649